MPSAIGLSRRTKLGASVSVPLETPPGGVNPHSWFRASTLGLADQASVASWTDLSGNSRDATQATEATKPIYRTGILNGRAVVRFAPTQYVRQGAFSAMAHPNTVIIVAKAASTSGSPVLFDGLGASNRHVAYIASASQWRMSAGTELVVGVPDLNWHIRSYVFDTTTSLSREDGVQVGSTGNAGTNTLTGLTIGATYLNNLGWNGDIADVLLYDSLLTTAEHNAVGNDLATEYALAWTNI